jgi:acyl-CoA reductase-like NAD-dependent aldehyde dehydrogenase
MLSQALGARRSARVRTIVRYTGLPPEVILDLALELVEIASRKLAPPPIRRTAVGLGAARWRNVSPEERSEILRRAVQARWAKHRL